LSNDKDIIVSGRKGETGIVGRRGFHVFLIEKKNKNMRHRYEVLEMRKIS
jgi:hypothetical protein